MDIHLDDENNDIVLHFFLPNHKKVLMASGAFQGFDQVSDFLRSSRQKNSAAQKNVDIDLGKSILKKIGVNGWTNIKLEMPIKNPPDMDLYISKQERVDKGVWIEFTTSKNKLKRHVLEKLGQIYLAKLLKMEKVKEKVFDEKKGSESEAVFRDISIEKFMHISLYPIEEMYRENENFSFFSFFDLDFLKEYSKGKIILDREKIIDFFLQPNLEERIRKKWEELISKIKKFINVK
ncbi:hypothetical protein [Mesoaciditoga lauensis]|uniref:hypothetical protein n=1 Tax=Mesoaciditoga lauensis TaxID=1495039 RepID=UPI0012E07B11|nr:hypothetical protein [Mesoaciditoga lauensis]